VTILAGRDEVILIPAGKFLIRNITVQDLVPQYSRQFRVIIDNGVLGDEDMYVKNNEIPRYVQSVSELLEAGGHYLLKINCQRSMRDPQVILRMFGMFFNL
jgi:hypothetical protein